MKNLNKPFLLSIILGLFVGLNFYMVFLYYLAPEFEWKSLGYQLRNYFENMLLFFTVGFVISVIFSLAIGWPLYLLAKLYSAVNYVTSVLAGIAVTTIPYILLSLFGWNLPSLLEYAGFMLVIVLIICGGSSGALFHFLAQKTETAEI